MLDPFRPRIAFDDRLHRFCRRGLRSRSWKEKIARLAARELDGAATDLQSAGLERRPHHSNGLERGWRNHHGDGLAGEFYSASTASTKDVSFQVRAALQSGQLTSATMQRSRARKETGSGA